MLVREMLEKVKGGEISIEEAENYFKRKPFEELGFAKLDNHRKLRSGFAEVVYCSGKSNEHLLNIFKNLYKSEGEVLGTRATKKQALLIKEHIPNAQYDPNSKILKIENVEKELIGNIVVCTAALLC